MQDRGAPMPQSRFEQLRDNVKDATRCLDAYTRAAFRTRGELEETRANTQKAISEARTLMKEADVIMARR
jgi:hypothetical protein